MAPEYFEAGSLVFRLRNAPTDLRDFRNWWPFVPGASWHAPEGPGSDINDRQDHPVVHVSLFDALAYGDWTDLALPREAEWEHAARDGVATEFSRGDALAPDGIARANTWQRKFPCQNDRTERAPFSMPARSFRVSRFGTFNMIGNVWDIDSGQIPGEPASISALLHGRGFRR